MKTSVMKMDRNYETLDNLTLGLDNLDKCFKNCKKNMVVL